VISISSLKTEVVYNNCMYSPHSAAVASISLIPILGRLSLRPVKNRGNYLSVRVGLLSLLY